MPPKKTENNPEIELAHYRLAKSVLAAKIGAKASAARGSKKDFSKSIEEAETAVRKLTDLQAAPEDVHEQLVAYLDAEEARIQTNRDRLQLHLGNPELASVLYPKAEARIDAEDLTRREIALADARLSAIADVRKEIS